MISAPLDSASQSTFSACETRENSCPMASSSRAKFPNLPSYPSKQKPQQGLYLYGFSQQEGNVSLIA